MYVNSVFRRRVVPSALTGLGDTSSQQVQIDSGDVLGLGDKLRAEQTRLANLAQLMRQSPALANTIGPDGKRLIDNLVIQQTALNDLITKYVQAYVAIFGQAPVGLGIAPILVAAAVAVLLSYIATHLYLEKQKNDLLEQQAQAAMLAEQNRASIIDMAQQKQDEATAKAAAGDQTGAADAAAMASSLLAQAGTPGTGTAPQSTAPQSFTDFIKANAIPIALTVGAIVLVPKLMDRF